MTVIYSSHLLGKSPFSRPHLPLLLQLDLIYSWIQLSSRLTHGQEPGQRELACRHACSEVSGQSIVESDRNSTELEGVGHFARHGKLWVFQVVSLGVEGRLNTGKYPASLILVKLDLLAKCTDTGLENIPSVTIT